LDAAPAVPSLNRAIASKDRDKEGTEVNKEVGITQYPVGELFKRTATDTSSRAADKSERVAKLPMFVPLYSRRNLEPV
jgi:hypothetical protein